MDIVIINSINGTIKIELHEFEKRCLRNESYQTYGGTREQLIVWEDEEMYLSSSNNESRIAQIWTNLGRGQKVVKTFYLYDGDEEFDYAWETISNNLENQSQQEDDDDWDDDDDW